MAGKYMGAKMLKKQLEKDKKKKENMVAKTKGTVHKNNQEFLERKGKRHFDITMSSMQLEGDFVDLDEDKEDENPIYSKAFDSLRRNKDFLLTLNEDNIGEVDMESDSDEENQKIEEML